MPALVTAKFSRRVLAICVDWAAASIISVGFFKYDPIATLAIYMLMQTILVGTLGFSMGHRALRLRVTRMDGTAVGPVRALVRTCLIALVIPAFVWDNDGRGLHDKAADTIITSF